MDTCVGGWQGPRPRIHASGACVPPKENGPIKPAGREGHWSLPHGPALILEEALLEKHKGSLVLCFL